jgi:DNA-binding beta-propeller fold protein YncE
MRPRFSVSLGWTDPKLTAAKIMRFDRQLVWLFVLVAIATAVNAQAAATLQPVWTHDAGGLGRAEIVAYDAVAQEFLVGNGPERCIIRLDARTGTEIGRFDVSAYGDPTSVAASHGLVAVAVVAPQKTDPGHVLLFRSATAEAADDTNGKPVAVIRVGALSDMVTFTPNGRYVLSANEGEPSDDYTTDPEGSISVIDVGNGAENAVALSADFIRFNAERESLERQGVRITAPNATAADGQATLAEDVEPEYIAVAPDGRTAWVTLQENNALAIVNVAMARVENVVGLGLKDHSRASSGFDASDGDGGVNIRRWPVFGMYQPDGIAAFVADGQTYLATANEGDSRGYAGFSDEARVKDLKLDESLRADDALGRLKVSRVGGDTDADGDVDRLLVFGSRSLAIWNADGALVYDSGDALEQYIAKRLPERFNIDSDGKGKIDDRSDDKGPEPEGVVVGTVGESTYAFVGLERTSAVAVFDVSRPESTKLIDIVPLALEKDSTGGSHIAPEGLCFVPAESSPLGVPLLAVACEVTGTTILFRLSDSH